MNFCAPEILQKEPYDALKADIWSLGALLFVMLVGRFAFQAKTVERLLENMLKGEFEIGQNVSGGIFL
jgi:MAP/microtubule affinity-regulating kinase